MSSRRGKRSRPQRNVAQKSDVKRAAKEKVFLQQMQDVAMFKEITRDQYNEYLLHIDSSNRDIKTQCVGFAVMLAKDSKEDMSETDIINTAKAFEKYITEDTHFNLQEPEFISEEDALEKIELEPFKDALDKKHNGN